MTDWMTTTATKVGECTAAGCIAAGNDLVMPGAEQDHENIRCALKAGTLCWEQIVRCVRNTIRICLMSNQVENQRCYNQQYSALPVLMCCEYRE